VARGFAESIEAKPVWRLGADISLSLKLPREHLEKSRRICNTGKHAYRQYKTEIVIEGKLIFR
jgi:hypothetical protein